MRYPAGLCRTTIVGIGLLGMMLTVGCASAPTVPARVTVLHDADPAATALVAYLESQHVQVTKAGGETRIEASDQCRQAIVRFMGVRRLEAATFSENIANVDTVQDADGKAIPYRRQVVVTGADGNGHAVPDDSPFQTRYDPGHPNADKAGMVLYPNVNINVEMVYMSKAAREYQLAAEILRRVDPSIVIAGVETGDPFEESD